MLFSRQLKICFPEWTHCLAIGKLGNWKKFDFLAGAPRCFRSLQESTVQWDYNERGPEKGG